MADSTITDRWGYWTAAGVFTGIQNAVIYAVPDMNTRRYDASGTYRTLGTNPGISVAAYAEGRSTTTDATGSYTFTLPYGATATRPTTPTPVWSLVFPDGKILTGTVPSVAGPLTVDDLVQTYSWTWASSVAVAPVTPGTLVRGTATFTAASSAAILFSVAFASSAYVIKLTPSVDSVTGNIPAVGWSSKTTSGFSISTTGIYTGSIDWEAVL